MKYEKEGIKKSIEWEYIEGWDGYNGVRRK